MLLIFFQSNAVANYPQRSFFYQGGDNWLNDSQVIQEAVDEYDKVIKLKPKIPEFHFRKALNLKKLGKFQEALSELDLAIKYRQDYAEARYEKAKILVLMKSFKKALVEINKVIDYRPDFYFAYGVKGYILYYLDRYKQAIKFIDKAIKNNAGYSDFYEIKVQALKQLGRYEEALLVFDEIIRNEAEHIRAGLDRIDYLKSLGDYNEATKTYHIILDSKVRQIRGYWEKAVIYEVIDNIIRYKELSDMRKVFSQIIEIVLSNRKKELENLDMVIKIYPKFGELYSDYVSVLLYQGKVREVFYSLKDMYIRHLFLSRVHMAKAISLAKQNLHEKALVECDKSIKINPYCHECYYAKGRAI
ncbi:MAG: tetratricopeptide repeat protein [Rickettsiaceae bacterium]|nr:tetratricopeptide repeat protein [Rickettsiaceae bacterium]